MSEPWNRYEHIPNSPYRTRLNQYVKVHPWNSTTGRPVPSPEWQAAVYEEEMGRKPPEPVSPQFDYNPRTKTGKALLEKMMDNG